MVQSEEVDVQPEEGANPNPRIDKAVRFSEAVTEYHCLREWESRAKSRKQELKRDIIEYMEDRDIQSTTTTHGPGVYRCKDRTFVSYLKDDKDKVFAWLEEVGCQDIIKPAIHSGTLSSTIAELQENGTVIPDFLKVHTEWSPGVRGNGYEVPELPSPVSND